MKLVILNPGHRWRGNRLASFELRAGPLREALSEAQGMVILALLGRPFLTRMDMAELAWEHPDDMPDEWLPLLWSRVWKINKKLATFRSSNCLAPGNLSACG